MKWLNNLENYNIYFKIHILNINDSIILSKQKQNDYMLYILDGFAAVLQTFTNNEHICVKLLYKNNLFYYKDLTYIQENIFYYRIVAIGKTTIMSIPKNKLEKKQTNKTNFDIIDVLSHKNTKKRIIQLLLILIKRFGQLNQQNITIPIYLSHDIIANIIGCQRVTVNRIMYNLKKKVSFTIIKNKL